ncbi:MAG: aldo/keto reductase [candidate division Zixibacteria bacterium]|nr:aldo/keto reductase [candidate division Zixibacteria bacterium]
MEEQNDGVTRRGFLTTAVSGLISAGLLSLPAGRPLAQETSEKAAPAKSKIITRRLGRTKLEIPIISMGVMNADNPEVVRASYEAGVRHFDTAGNYQYGRNEQMVGIVINKLGVRDKVTIATKIMAPALRRGLNSTQIKEKFYSTFEGSLSRLNTDYVDILYLHDVSSVDDVLNPASIEAMGLLREQKKVRFVGVSTHSEMAAVIDAVARSGFYDVVLTSCNFTMADDLILRDAIKNAAAKGVGIVAMKTLAGGRRLPGSDSTAEYAHGTATAAALKWVLRNESITTAIPGYDNFEHMKEDFAVAYDLEYTAEEKKFLSDNKIRLSYGFCRQCRRCLATCPHETDIPSLMRTYMYAAQYSDFHQARTTLDDISETRGLRACRSCTNCTARCAHDVNIPRRIEELKIIYT